MILLLYLVLIIRLNSGAGEAINCLDGINHSSDTTPTPKQEDSTHKSHAQKKEPISSFFLCPESSAHSAKESSMAFKIASILGSKVETSPRTSTTTSFLPA